MIVVFKNRKHDNDLIDQFISLWTRSRFIHAQILFSNDQIGGSWMDTGVAFKTQRETMIFPFLYEYVQIPASEIDEQAVYDYIRKHKGEKFNMYGAIIATVIPVRISNRDKRWHCTEITYAALRAGGLKTKHWKRPPESISPQLLYDMLVKERGYPKLEAVKC